MPDSVSGASDAQLLIIVDQLRTVLTENLTDYPMITSGMKSNLDTLRDAFNTKLAAQAAAVDEPKMTALGIPVSSVTAPAAATVPAAAVDTSQRIRQTA